MELFHVYTRNIIYFLKLLNYSQSENLKELYYYVKLTGKKQRFNHESICVESRLIIEYLKLKE